MSHGLAMRLPHLQMNGSYTPVLDFMNRKQGCYYHLELGRFLMPEPNGVGEGVYGIGRVLRRRRRRDGFSVEAP